MNCATVTDQYTLALGKDSPLQRVEQELVEHSELELEQLCHSLTRQTNEARTQLSRVHQRRGALLQQSQGLVSDRRLPELKLQLGCVVQQLEEAAHRWRVLSVAAHVLELVREVYETQRQPQTLQDASRYFAALTEGQYVRIWTPLTDMSLRVDMTSGETLSLDVLSSGTREAVFLSLRLALVADFTRRGIVLPLILDDVLVNFDRRRAQLPPRSCASSRSAVTRSCCSPAMNTSWSCSRPGRWRSAACRICRQRRARSSRIATCPWPLNHRRANP